MKPMEWRKEGKADWGPGPWQDEPDQVQWVDATTGLPCLAKRNMRGGNWCGYVGVAEGHTAFQKGYEDVDADVHGGLTYADFCEGEPGEGICHLPEAGEPDRVWWLGFDCAHGWDRRPGDEARWKHDPILSRFSHDASYKSLGYVKSECTKLAAQLKAMQP